MSARASELRAIVRHPEFRAGVRAIAPQAIGTVAWGLMAGVAMAKSGLSLVEALLMGVVVYAGSSQLAALPLLVAGAPIGIILATAFCVNLRFVVFSLHLRPYVSHLPLLHRLAFGYFTTDMGYVLFTTRFHQPPRTDAERQAQRAFHWATSSVNWAAWVIPSVAGILLANAIPQRWGLGYAATLCLLGMVCAVAKSRLRIAAAGVAGAAAIAAHALPLKLNIVVAIAAAVMAGLVLESRRPAPGVREVR